MNKKERYRREYLRWLGGEHEETSYLLPEIAEPAQPDDQETGEQRVDEMIKDRRQKVANLWRRGKSDKEIAEALSISESTVYRDRKAQGLRSRKTKS